MPFQFIRVDKLYYISIWIVYAVGMLLNQYWIQDTRKLTTEGYKHSNYGCRLRLRMAARYLQKQIWRSQQTFMDRSRMSVFLQQAK